LKLFLDTSSLLKLYHKEEGSEELVEMVLSANALYLSSLAKLEFKSALWKKVRTKEIEMDACQAVIQLFQDDYSQFSWVEQDQQLNKEAESLIMKWGKEGLRALDAIQLASAVTLRAETDMVYSTSDKLLHKLFVRENLAVR